MRDGYEKIGSLSERSIVVPESWIFAHPTRLTRAWEPRMLEIVHRGDTLHRPAIEVGLEHGSSKTLGIRTRNRVRRVFQRLAAPITYIDRPVLDARFETDNNIAHLLTLVLPKLLAFQKFGGRGAVILRQNASSLGRKFFHALDVPVLCTDRFVIGDLIRTGETVQGAFEGWYPDLFRDVRFFGEVSDTPAKVFLARRGQRRLINEELVEDLLVRCGFRKVYFENIPIGEQWSWLRNAKAVVAVHGAGMAALLFSRPNVKVVELFHPGFVNDIYRNMTAAIGGSWCGVTGKITKDTIGKLDYTGNPHAVAMDSFEVDVTTVQCALEYLNITQ
jgi:capsular polysaccharide biosynthesis protein